jgi:uncharacterized protein YbbC (DUF1343 family)
LNTQTPPVRYGIDMISPALEPQLRGKRVGMVTNDAATTGAAYAPKVAPSRVALQQAGIELAALFAPEHGMGAAAMDGDTIGDERDPLTGAPVYSLYGDRFRPAAEQLAGLDLLLFDIPDVGARFYTYAWTLSHVMEACAEVGLPLWVLDRPNPIGGNLRDTEGPMLDPAISTFVGRWNIPIRHSLTLGELAFLWRYEQDIPLNLNVIKANGWQRAMHWPETGNPFVPTSPALPSYEVSLIYPGTCLFEGTNVSEGRGTSTPFLQIGAPWIDARTLSERFNQHQFPGVLARPVHFVPAASKHAGQLCHGVMLHTLAPKEVRPVLLGLHLLVDVIQLHPKEFQWLPYPTAANAPGYGHIERLLGRLDAREALQAQPDERTLLQWTQTANWLQRVQPFLMY